MPAASAHTLLLTYIPPALPVLTQAHGPAEHFTLMTVSIKDNGIIYVNSF